MSDGCGCSSPRSGNGANPANSPVQACPYANGSEILIINEIGLPLVNTPVTVRISGGNATNATTDSNGKICLNVPPGTSVQVEIANVHEITPGESTSTGSGRHFAANGTGP
jgi:hypothetical protein